jgi:hypothetical protein
MAENKSPKKIVRAAGAEDAKSVPLFVASEASEKKALQQRLLAALLWVAAIGLEVWAIFILKTWATSPNMPLLIGLIVGDLILAIGGALLWKSANRLDPASKKDTVKFFVQNQLGLIIAVIAFLPLLVLILANKDMDKNQKALAGGIAAAAVAIAGYFGLSLNPPSVEEYSDQIAEVKGLTGGKDFVYWTKAGTHYHVYSDCRAINSNRTEEIIEGSVGQARELKNITNLCSFCRTRGEKAMAAASPLPGMESPAATPEAQPAPAATPVSPPAETPAATVPVPAPDATGGLMPSPVGAAP